jgi:hypothetical protein
VIDFEVGNDAVVIELNGCNTMLSRRQPKLGVRQREILTETQKHNYSLISDWIYRQRHPEAQFEHVIKLEVFTHYSDGKPKCKRCGFDDIRALTLDHINGDGYIQRKELKRKGSSFYFWARENGYPHDLQVLCHNCQWIKRHENKEHRGGHR